MSKRQTTGTKAAARKKAPPTTSTESIETSTLTDSTGTVDQTEPPFQDIDIPVAKATEAWEAVKDRAEAIPTDRLHPLRYPASEAAARGLWVAGNAKKDIVRFEGLYREPPIELILLMETLALSVKGAEQASLVPVPVLTTEQLQSFRKLRGRILAVLQAVFFDDEDVEAEIDRIQRGSSQKDLGDDLLELAKLISQPETWKKLVATGLVNQTDLTALETAGAAVLAWVGSKPKTKGAKKPTQPARILEQRAWTQMAEAYNKLRDLALPLYREDTASWEYHYPNLLSFNQPSSRKKSKPSTTSNATTPTTQIAWDKK